MMEVLPHPPARLDLSYLPLPESPPTRRPHRVSPAQVPNQVEDAQTTCPTERWAQGTAQSQCAIIGVPRDTASPRAPAKLAATS